MTIEAGVWIDEHKAVVFLAAEGGAGFQHFLADPAGRLADGLQQPASDQGRPQRHSFYDEIIACIHEADGIVVLGPGEPKWELARRMAFKKLKGDVAHVGEAETLTESAIAGIVRDVLDNRGAPRVRRGRTHEILRPHRCQES